jgi:hypothetical protein
VKTTLPGCAHTSQDGWLEIEVMRQTVGGWQHVAWVDMDPNTPGNDRYYEISGAGGYTLAFTWDGIAQTGLGLADHPNVFHGTKGSFNRAMPKVESGKPVPPPFYTVFARLLNANKEPVEEVPQQVFIPQVVNIVPASGRRAFRDPVVFDATNGNPQVTLYSGCTEAESAAAIAQLPGMAMAFIPGDVNLRVVMRDDIIGDHKTVFLIRSTSRGPRRGESEYFTSRNQNASGEMHIFISGFERSLKDSYKYMIGGNKDSVPTNMTPVQFAKYIAPTITHEIGHNLGLVDPQYLDATTGGDQKNHNKVQTWRKLMDRGGLHYVGDRMNPHPTNYWRSDNLRYLQFVLPQ